MAKPGLIAMGIFNFLGQWNQFLLPPVLIHSEDKYMLSQSLNFMAIQQGYSNDYSGLFAPSPSPWCPRWWYMCSSSAGRKAASRQAR
jgi:hypothetical protein